MNGTKQDGDKKYFYSMFSWFGYFMPFEERIRAIADAGFDEVMISWEDEEAPVLISRETFPDTVRRHGLGITNFHAPYIGYNAIWEKPLKENRELLDTFVQMVADCHRFDVPALVVHTNDLDLGPYEFENGLAFFSELAEVGECWGVDIAVENVSRQYLLRYLLDRIRTPHFGMCYDSSHDYMLHCCRGRILADYGERIKALHLSDNDLHWDKHWIPGEGKIPLGQVMDGLDAVGWRTLSMEIIADADNGWKDKEPSAFCRQALKNLKELSSGRTR